MSVEIGQNIKFARIAAGLTQEELAYRCGVATITIRQYESGRRGPNLKQLSSIARAIGVDWADLVPDPDPDEIESDVDDEYSEPKIFPDDLRQIAQFMNQMNPAGRKRVKAYARDIARIPEYQRQGPPQPVPAPPEGEDTTPAEPPSKPAEKGG